jgi:NAD(P)H-hydrate epimerase
MKIATAQQMGELDATTLREEQIPSIDLMERAAAAIAREVISRWDATTPIVVFAGPGNNGGDALAVARLLIQSGYDVETYLINVSDKLSTDCLKNKIRLTELPEVKFNEINSQFEPPILTKDMVVIDGLFGTGLRNVLSGGFAALVKFINASPAYVVSIDMPSGLMGEDNTANVRAHIVQADLTLTFQLPKLSLLLADTQCFVGELKVMDIGLSPEAIERLETKYELVNEEFIHTLLKARDNFGHKGTFGHALLVAGQYGMAGAAILGAKSCLRCGVGKVTIHTPHLNNDILQISLPEAVVSHDKHPEKFTQAVTSDGFDALAIGPGIGTDNETALAFIEQVRHAKIPLLIDADGLNILGSHKGWMQQVPKESIFTPHPLEMRRMGIRSENSYSTLDEAIEMSVRYHIYIILKGHHTAICTPEGKVYFNTTGNDGMATAGSGDVLTGIILSLLAQKYSPLHACLLGVFLHGRAGDYASLSQSQESMIASDIIDNLYKAFNSLKTINFQRNNTDKGSLPLK